MEYLTPTQIVTNWLKVNESMLQHIIRYDGKWVYIKFDSLISYDSLITDDSLPEGIIFAWCPEWVGDVLEGIDDLEPEDQDDLLSSTAILQLAITIHHHVTCAKKMPESDELRFGQEKLAGYALRHTLLILSQFRSQYVLDLISNAKSDKHNPLDEPVKIILDALHIIDDFSEATLAIYKDNYLPISALVLRTMDMQACYSSYIEKNAKGRQQRKAANNRHLPSRQTKAFATSLYDEKPDRNPRATAIAILGKVQAYGATVGFTFSDDLAAHNRIYTWMRDHKNNK
jgi:hypothetical protein